jgi:hypothetical protein
MEGKHGSAVRMLALGEEPNAGDFVATPEPLALLHRIARESLPLILTDDRDIESVSTLVHAGQIEATMQVVLPPWLGSPQPGLVVSRITRVGWMALALQEPDPPSAPAHGQQEGRVICDSNRGPPAARL